MAQLHDEFDWDPDKADLNEETHRVSFLEAAYVLQDEEGDRFHLDVFDDRHVEERWKTYASDPDDRSIVYIIVWTPRRERTRIISARFADSPEKKFYEQHLPKNP